MHRASLVVILCAACGGDARAPGKPAPTTATATEVELSTRIADFVTGHLGFRPTLGIELGLHEYDGVVPDRSPEAVAAEIARLKAALATFEAIDPARVGHRAQVEREVVLAEIRKELFELEVRRRPSRDPFYYLRGFSLNPYIARDYAPAAQRAAAMLRACEGAPAYYRQAAAQLELALPKAWLQVGVMMSGGTIDFVNGAAKQAFASLPDAALRGRLEACLDTLASELTEFQGALKSRFPAGTDDFRLGADTMIAMLRATEGIDLDIATLERVIAADLERNRAALVAAAKALDPAATTATVVAKVTADKPSVEGVLDEATSQLTQLQRFVADHKLVSLPRKDPIEVRASPSFMRGNFAALGGVGPFESSALASFYYIAPPDPAWPEAEQKAYLPSVPDLLFVSAHEVFPGHFVQGMHQRASGSRVLQMFETYTASEGWAHYVEEMLWEQGLGEGAPRIHIGQLKNALLRDVRFAVALGYHAGTMTVDEATKMFQDLAFADPGNARQQALRGTVDPMFLGYTLGKLIIMELRADWQRAHPGAAIGAFHDELLSYGEAPLPVTRRMMLGAAAGPPLRDR